MHICGDEHQLYIPEGGCDCNYSLEEVESTEYEKTYVLKSNGSQVGVPINIPKDKVISNALVLTVVEDGVPYEEAVIGDRYIQITIHNSAERIYIPLDSYTRQEVDELVATASRTNFIVVDELPTASEETLGSIYLLPSGATYQQWVTTDCNSVYNWVQIGDTEVNLDNYYTKNEITSMFSSYMLTVYPVGSIYCSVTSASPSSLFGGTWVKLQDCFLVGAGNMFNVSQVVSDVGVGSLDLDATDKDGGEYTHLLTENELPEMSGAFSLRRYGSTGTLVNHSTSREVEGNIEITHGSDYDSYKENGVATTNTLANLEKITIGFGGGEEHENTPPYFAVNMWKRVA